MKEIWKDVKGYEGIYRISNLGNIKSIDRIINRNVNGKVYKVRRKGHLLSASICKRGYYRIHLHDGKNFLISRLVAMAFIPNNKNLPQINHKNGIKTDNRVCNLEWCTPKENMRHAFDSGLKDNKGENHSQAKLKTNDILKIRSLKGKVKIKDIAKMYNIHEQYVWNIQNKRAWKHL